MAYSKIHSAMTLALTPTPAPYVALRRLNSLTIISKSWIAIKTAWLTLLNGRSAASTWIAIFIAARCSS